ncbi:hypothetical protein GCM10029964_090970 [Kibdelosporangium lantanae]
MLDPANLERESDRVRDANRGTRTPVGEFPGSSQPSWVGGGPRIPPPTQAAAGEVGGMGNPTPSELDEPGSPNWGIRMARTKVGGMRWPARWPITEAAAATMVRMSPARRRF